MIFRGTKLTSVNRILLRTYFIVLPYIFCQCKCIGGRRRKAMNFNVFRDREEKRENIVFLCFYPST